MYFVEQKVFSSQLWPISYSWYAKMLTLTIFRQNHFPDVQKYQQIFEGGNFLICGPEVIYYLYAFFSPKCLVLGHFLIGVSFVG